MDLRPSSRAGAGPEPLAGPSAHRRLLTVDGVALSAVYDRPGPEAGSTAFVIAHGFTGSWSRHDSRRVATGLVGYGGVISFDMRGHGHSSGASTIGDAEAYDVDAAVAYAHWLGHSRVVTVGFSMGASAVLRQHALAGAGHRPDAVVAVSSAGFWFYRGTAPMRLLHRTVNSRTGRAVLRTGFGTRVTDQMWQEPYPVSPSEAAALIAPTPLLIVHGDLDGYFPAEHAESVFAAARVGALERGVADNTTYWLERGFAHAESSASSSLIARIGAWATSVEAASPSELVPRLVPPDQL